MFLVSKPSQPRCAVHSPRTPDWRGISEWSLSPAFQCILPDIHAEALDRDPQAQANEDAPHSLGASGGTRTRNLLITNQLLCQLSHAGRVPGEAPRPHLRTLRRGPVGTQLGNGAGYGTAGPWRVKRLGEFSTKSCRGPELPLDLLHLVPVKLQGRTHLLHGIAPILVQERLG